MLRRCLIALAATIVVALPGAATNAQDLPARTVKVVVAFPAGGPTDFVARLLADKLKPLVGQNVIVENKPGANGAIGADFVAKAEPDGTTLFLTTVGAVAITPNLRTDLPYDPVKDFAPIMRVVRNTTMLVVNPEVKITSAKELAALAKEKPGAIPFASTGVGSMHAPRARALPIGGWGEIPARALSRRGAGAHRPAWRTGPCVVC